MEVRFPVTLVNLGPPSKFDFAPPSIMNIMHKYHAFPLNCSILLFRTTYGPKPNIWDSTSVILLAEKDKFSMSLIGLYVRYEACHAVF